MKVLFKSRVSQNDHALKVLYTFLFGGGGVIEFFHGGSIVCVSL